MKTGIWVSLLLSILCLPALADTDYHCLNGCVNDGGTSTKCMEQCAYNSTAPKLPVVMGEQPTTAINNAHKTLSAPISAQGKIYMAPFKVQEPDHIKDYQCISKCQQQSLQLQFCEKQCDKSSKKMLVKHQ